MTSLQPNKSKPLINKFLNHATRIAFLGIGSDLRGDDVAGMVFTAKLEEIIKKLPKTNMELAFFFGGTAPENVTGEIKRFNPTHLIIIDAAELGKPAGTIEIVDINNITGVSFSTHMMPPSVLVQYLLQYITCDVLIVGIQPKTLEFGAGISIEVQNSIDLLLKQITDIFI